MCSSDLLVNELKEIGDLERLISRISTGRANPREVVALKSSLKKIPAVIEQLSKLSGEMLEMIRTGLDPLEKLVDKIQMSIVDSPPASINDGGIIRNGFSEELDELRDIAFHGKDWIARDRKSTRLNSSHIPLSRMPSSA